MNLFLNLLRSLDWRVLFAVPALSVLLGIANNLRVPEDRRVVWSGEFQTADAAENGWSETNVRNLMQKVMRTESGRRLAADVFRLE